MPEAASVFAARHLCAAMLPAQFPYAVATQQLGTAQAMREHRRRAGHPIPAAAAAEVIPQLKE